MAKIHGLSAWQTFWRIEFPFALPLLSWNMMMSLSASWFIVVACEVIKINDTLTFHLPGLGSYLDKANLSENNGAIMASLLTMFLVIIVFDQLLNHLITLRIKIKSENPGWSSCLVIQSGCLEH